MRNAICSNSGTKPTLNIQRNETREASLAIMADIASRTAKLQAGVVGKVSQASNDSVKVTFGVCAVLLVLGLLIGIFLTRSITTPMAKTLASPSPWPGASWTRGCAWSNGMNSDAFPRRWTVWWIP